MTHRLVLAAGFVLASGTSALAEFPERAIEVIFPWTQGAAMAASQIIADAMSDELGVPVTIVSTPGAAGTRAFETAMNRPADGYTLIDGYVAPLVLQPILGNADWSFQDFAPLHAGVSNPFSIGTAASNDRFADFEEMMAYCSEYPGQLRYSTDIRNNLPHMVTAWVLQAYDCVAQNVPYDTQGNSLSDLKSGILDFAFVPSLAFLQEPEAFNIEVVLSDLESSSEMFGGAPLISELDVELPISGLAPMGWDWWVVHPDTPEDRLAILRAAMTAAMARPEVQEKLANVGFAPLPHGHEEYADVVGPVIEQLESMRNAIAWEEQRMAETR